MVDIYTKTSDPFSASASAVVVMILLKLQDIVVEIIHNEVEILF